MKTLLVLTLLALAGCTTQPRSTPSRRAHMQAVPEATRQQMAAARADIDAAKEGVTFRP